MAFACSRSAPFAAITFLTRHGLHDIKLAGQWIYQLPESRNNPCKEPFMRYPARSLACLLAVLSLVIASSPRVQGQTSLAEIVGDVRDATGNAMPRVSVVLTNEATGVGTSLLTNDAGAFSSTSMLPGVYRIEASSAGFKTYAATHVELRTGQLRLQE